MKNLTLLSVEEALDLSEKSIEKLYKSHINPEMVSMLEMLNFNKKFVRAAGTEIWDEQGRRYLDFLGAYGAMSLGHNHPKVIEAVQKVQGRPNLVQTALGGLAAALAHNLAEVAPGKLNRMFFGNSGAEAVEGALKLARIASGRPGFIACRNSFHGKSFGALSVTGREKYQKYFQPLLQGCTLIPYGDEEALEAALRSREAAAFIVEPIQGEGGIILPPENYLAEAQELCHKYGTLLIMDEVQTGLGRTGTLFACQQEGVEPDILCLAKALGGGIMPIGTYITTDEIWQKAYGSWNKALLHTSTFGGNTWACAAGLAALQVIIEEDLPGQAAAKGRYFLSELQKESSVLLKEARGRGLMIGLEFNSSGSGLMGKLTDKWSEEYLGSLVAGKLMNEYGIITAYTLNNPNVVRLEPPLTISQDQLDQCLQAIRQILLSQKSFWGLGASAAKNKVKNLFKTN